MQRGNWTICWLVLCAGVGSAACLFPARAQAQESRGQLESALVGDGQTVGRVEIRHDAETLFVDLYAHDAEGGGGDGRFGEEDAELEDAILPDHEGPVDQGLENTELGRAFEAAIAQSGALSLMFEDNNLAFGMGRDFATAGDGDAFVIGRRSGGLGLRASGRGGGQCFGLVRDVGDIDTSGGRGVIASLGRRDQRAPHTARPRLGQGIPLD
jgi:hypothetical protein